MAKITSSKTKGSLWIPTLLLDAAVVFCAALFACRLMLGEIPWDIRGSGSAAYMYLIISTSLAAMPVFAAVGPSVFSRGVRFWWLVRQVVYGVIVLSILTLVVLFATKLTSEFSRRWFVVWMGTTCVGLIGARLFLIGILSLLRRTGVNQKRVVIVGSGPMGRSLVSRVTGAAWPSFQLVGIFDRRKTSLKKETDIPVYSNFDDLSQFVDEHNIQEVWIALPMSAEKHIERVTEDMMQTTATVRFVPDTFGLKLSQHRVTEIHGMPMFNLSSSKMVGLNRVIKAALDYTMAFTVLATIGPLIMLPVAIAVKLTSRGPVFFHQKRHGWDGRKFSVYKFRSMTVHAEKSGVITQAGANDSRITSIGKFLRQTSLDELPQFINVLQGRMSIVGPRPHAVEHNEEYKTKIRHYMRRHKVKPGITGFAQIKGWRGQTDTVHKMRKRVQYDLYYLENWTIGFDVKIIWLTFFRGFIHPNAY
jgi:putative colanic acid biosynthesis UDP-glucose lipid carrier transferase